MGASLLTDEEKEIIRIRSLNGVSIKNIAREINRHYSTIKSFEDKHNLPSNPDVYGIAREDRDPIYKLYIDGLNCREIHEQFYPQYTSDQINHICRVKGITRPNGKVANLNHDYFEHIDSSRKAYWLGLLLADGCVQEHKKKGNSFSITLELMTDDKYIIEQFAEDVEATVKVRTYINEKGFQRKDGKPHSQTKVGLWSVKMANDLAKYGVVPKKSYLQKHIPQIPEEYMSNFLLGYFDGNGSITYSTSNNHFAVRVIFYGDHTLLSDITNYISEIKGLTARTVVDQKKAQVSLLTYGAFKDVEMFYHYFYDNADIYLKRKKDKFEELMKQYRDKHSA